MTLTHLLRGSALLLAIALFSCGGGDSTVRDAARESLNVNESTPTSPQVNPTGAVAGTNANVQHYICPNNCAGSGGPAAGICPVCGTEYVHNQAFHNQTQQVNTSGTPGQPATPPTPEPAQNASGVWHYTCPNGCDGGAGSAVACANCGTTLAHNAAYHQ